MPDELLQNFQQKIASHGRLIEQELINLLSDKPRKGEITRPFHLMAAMRHGSLNGGKRLRPFLVLETAKIFTGNSKAALKVATALECVHCYSLIHDDLPAMDDDGLRRGKPTVHIAFDEAIAILAGDGLLTLAFDIISSETTPLDANSKIRLISQLAQAAGIGGMVGGQALDIAAETQSLDETDIITFQQMKTGALIRYACQAGVIIGQANHQYYQQMTEYGQLIGQAFQLADDLLDITSNVKTMGKNTGKDAKKGKATLINIHGIDWAKTKLQSLSNQAITLLDNMDKNTDPLKQIARFIISRDR